MQVEVTVLTRRGADALMRKTQSVTAEMLRFGRGSDNEVQLADIRVSLHAAELMQREGGLFIERAGEEPMRVNGASTVNSTLKIGDKIHLGPYEIAIAAPTAGFDAAVTVEMVQPLGDALERLMAQSRIGLGRAMSKRAWSWVLFLIFAIGGLILPIALYPFGHVVTSARTVPPSSATNYISVSWNAGDISNPHRFFAIECSTCHRAAFSSVPDQACLSCHQTVGSHLEQDADVGTPRKQLNETRCAECHVEHRGVHSLVIQAQSLCVDCHETLDKTAPKSGIQSVTGFPSGHPQFRATVVADAAKPSFARETLETAPPPQDKSGIVFSHAAHLVPAGFLTPAGKKIMVCADCHVAEPSGQGFQPVTFEAQCHSCHDLKFDAALPWREVPHGDAAGVALAVTDFYGHMALQGGVQDASAPDFVRRPVGQPMPEPTPEAAPRPRSPGRRSAPAPRWTSSGIPSAAAPTATSPARATTTSPWRRWCCASASCRARSSITPSTGRSIAPTATIPATRRKAATCWCRASRIAFRATAPSARASRPSRAAIPAISSTGRSSGR